MVNLPSKSRKSFFSEAEIEMQDASAMNKRFAVAEERRELHPNINRKIRVR